MTRYRATLNGVTFFDSNSRLLERQIVSGKVSLEQGKAGACSFQVGPGNPAYTHSFSIADRVKIYRDAEVLFSGRVTKPKQLNNTIIEFKCEGLLAILNDTVFAPSTYNCTLEELVTAMIDSHNNQVEEGKQIEVGVVDAYEGYLYRAYENYESTWKRLSDLQSTYGGYISINEVNDRLVLNFRADDPQRATQSIDFGSNLLDINHEEDLTKIITVLLPLGANIEGEDGTYSRLTIADVNGGSNFLESELTGTYGRITAVKTWNDVTVAGNLMTKGQEFLNANDHPATNINVTAIDLAQIDPELNWFDIGEQIQVTSARHGISGLFILRKQDIDLVNPGNNKFKLGEMSKGLVGYDNSNKNSFQNAIEIIRADYVTNEELADTIEETQTTMSSMIEQSASEISSTVEALIEGQNGVIESLRTQVVQNAEAVEIWINDFEKRITFDDNGITIRADGSDVYSQQDEDSYGFYDNNGNELLVIEPDGLKATTVETKAQFVLSDGNYKEWAIRKGVAANSKHNLNIVWIGG